MTTLTFPAYMLAAVREKADSLARLAARLRVEAPTVNVLREFQAQPEFYFLPESTQDRLTRGTMAWQEVPEIPHVEVEILGTTPVLPGGWRLLATVEHTEAGNFVDCSPTGRDMGLGDLLRDARPTCDHCGTVRMRRWTCVVADNDGNQVRVGKGCLAGFLGFAGMPEDALLRFSRELREMDDDSWGLSSGRRLHTFLEIATVAFAAVRTHGWVRSDDYRHIPTRNRVGNHLTARNDSERVDIDEVDHADAAAANAWLLEADTTGNEFLGNLATLARLGVVEGERMGLAAAVVPAFRRHQQDEIKRAEKAARPTAPVILGNAVVITGTVVGVDAKYSDYGVRHVMTVTDDRGFTVWGSIPSSLNVKRGDRVTFTAAVEASDDPTFGFTKRPRKAAVLV